jgi:hypothetical protein
LADLIGIEAILGIERKEEKDRNEKAIFLLLGWTEKKWEIGRILAVAGQQILSGMVIWAKKGEGNKFSEDMGGFANGISAL